MAIQSSELFERVKAKLKMRFVDLLDSLPINERRQLNREKLKGDLRHLWETLPDEVDRFHLSREDEEELFADIIDDITGLGPLDRFMADESVSEIMINGPKEIFVERGDHLERVEGAFRDTTHLMTVIERMLGNVGLTVSEAAPVCDASLPDGSRINVIIPPLVLNGPVVTIRRRGRERAMKDLIALGTLTEEAAEFLESCVRAKVNFIVSGGTSTGKTTLVEVLSRAIPADHRVITIENVAELELRGRSHWIRLVGHHANIEGKGEISLRVLVKNALRMRPDRIILGEARGGEALDVVQAMHSGHDGVITVLHGNTAHAALERLQTLMLMSGLDLPHSLQHPNR